MVKKSRKQLYIDPPVQGPIVKRVIVYWFACLGFLTLPMVLASVAADPKTFVLAHVPGVIAENWHVLLCMTLLLPLAVLDALKMSNRFAGPIYRLRNEMKKHNHGQGINKIELRSDDYWHEIAHEFNSLIENLPTAEAPDAASAPSADNDLVCAEA